LGYIAAVNIGILGHIGRILETPGTAAGDINPTQIFEKTYLIGRKAADFPPVSLNT
jgi:hypothetical protein